MTRRLSDDQVNERIQSHNQKWVRGEYENKTSRLEVRCNECNDFRVASAQAVMNHGCPYCAMDRKSAMMMGSKRINGVYVRYGE